MLYTYLNFKYKLSTYAIESRKNVFSTPFCSSLILFFVFIVHVKCVMHISAISIKILSVVNTHDADENMENVDDAM